MWNKDDIIKRLKDDKRRITEQRKTVIDVMSKNDYTNVKELYYEVSKVDSAIGLATVYRTILALEKIGVLERRHGYIKREMYS